MPALVFAREGRKGGGVQLVRELDGWSAVSSEVGRVLDEPDGDQPASMDRSKTNKSVIR